jgi:hypothetical protein
MGPGRSVLGSARRNGRLWDFLTFDRMLTGGVIHIVYWCGLGVNVLIAFSVVGAAIGVAFREGSALAILAALPVLIGGLLIVAVLGLLWRTFCEFYIVIFKISDDLHALREAAEAETNNPPPRT